VARHGHLRLAVALQDHVGGQSADDDEQHRADGEHPYLPIARPGAGFFQDQSGAGEVSPA
jgi:hypothetical protein